MKAEYASEAYRVTSIRLSNSSGMINGLSVKIIRSKRGNFRIIDAKRIYVKMKLNKTTETDWDSHRKGVRHSASFQSKERKSFHTAL